MRYFSERELGELPRDTSDISPRAWQGLAWQIQRRLTDGSFGLGFPKGCPDSPSICCGVDRHGFEVSIRAANPVLDDGLWPSGWEITAIEHPPALVIMDIIEFCWEHVGSPTYGTYHSFFQHHHLDFDKGAGQTEYKEDVNQIFRRNGIAFNLTHEGTIERLLPLEIDTSLRWAMFQTGDVELDTMLATARRKILDPDENEHREAVEKLWEAWERIKTIESTDKKGGVEKILNEAADSSVSKFRGFLEEEAKVLTDAGNTFQIRHSETSQEHLESSGHVDYMFFRMFTLLNLIITSRRDDSKSG